MKVDLVKTKAYYQALKEDALCDCEPCKQYYLNIRAFFPDLALWLDGYGALVEKPFEVMSIVTDEWDKACYLSVQYLFFGTCPKDFSHTIGDFDIRRASTHSSTDIREAHFVLEAFYTISPGFFLEG